MHAITKVGNGNIPFLRGFALAPPSLGGNLLTPQIFLSQGTNPAPLILFLSEFRFDTTCEVAKPSQVNKEKTSSSLVLCGPSTFLLHIPQPENKGQWFIPKWSQRNNKEDTPKNI